MALAQLIEDAEALARIRGRLDDYRGKIGDETCSRPETDDEVLDRLLGPVVVSAPLDRGVLADVDVGEACDWCKSDTRPVASDTAGEVVALELAFVVHHNGACWLAASFRGENATVRLCLDGEGPADAVVVLGPRPLPQDDHFYATMDWERFEVTAGVHKAQLVMDGPGVIKEPALCVTTKDPVADGRRPGELWRARSPANVLVPAGKS